MTKIKTVMNEILCWDLYESDVYSYHGFRQTQKQSPSTVMSFQSRKILVVISGRWLIY